jgi:ribosomal protein L7/L12
MEHTRDEVLEELISNGIGFLRSLTEYYGTDRGIEIWDQLGSAVGTDVQGQIFMRMLKGSDHVVFSCKDPYTVNAVGLIKCVRSYTGLSLQEAKYLWDKSLETKVKLKVDINKKAEFVRDLRQLAVTLHND